MDSGRVPGLRPGIVKNAIFFPRIVVMPVSVIFGRTGGLGGTSLKMIGARKSKTLR